MMNKLSVIDMWIYIGVFPLLLTFGWYCLIKFIKETWNE